MISDALQRWLFVIFATLTIADPQVQMPMPYPMAPCVPVGPCSVPMQPIPPPPVPMPYPMPIGIGLAVVPSGVSSTTTTTAKPVEQYSFLGSIDNISVALPMLPMPPIPVPMPVGMPPPPMPLPYPVPIGIGLAIIQNEISSTTTTTTTAKPFIQDGVINIPPGIDSIAIALPMPQMSLPMPIGMSIPSSPIVPQPVQFAVSGVIPSYCTKGKPHPSCPPCPPCSCSPCTPSFFSYCSKCHQKCRCKNSKDTPVPLPPNPPVPLSGPAFPMPFPMSFPIAGIGPIPGSPNIVIIPYPPEMVPPRRHKLSDNSHKKHYEDSNECSDSSNDHQSYESDSSTYSHKKKIRSYINNGIYERSYRNVGAVNSDHILVKPELNYVNDKGIVKIKKNLNKNDIIKLMNQ